MQDSGIELCLTIDDLPLHGASHPELSRRDITRIFIDTLSKHHISTAVGFTNGGMTDPASLYRVLRLANRKVCRRMLRVLMHANIMDIHAYVGGQFPDTSTAYIEILQDWLNAGHILGNHTYWHSDINRTNPRLFIKGIEKNERLLNRLSISVGHQNNDRRLFRYPYLKEGDSRDKRDQIKNYLNSHHYTVAPVTVDFRDWAWNRAYLRLLSLSTADKLEVLQQKYIEMAVLALKSSVLAARQLFGRDIRHVLLLHMGAFTAISLDQLLQQYSKLGVRFIDMEQALADEIYERVPDILQPLSKGRSFLEQWKIARNEPPCLVSRFVRDDELFRDC